jgi:hypothetical protein
VRRCDYCGGPIPSGKRLDARYCSGLCKGRGRHRNGSDTANHGNPGKSRRSSRDGSGAKVYLLPSEIRELRLGPPYQPALLAKLLRAQERTSV